MATLILTSVGRVIGGPIGGAIGALIGQSIDARLFAPKGREGPRLSDLRIQTSSYGTAIPRLYGRMRVAGTVIWATDLIEHRNRQGGGKGRGSTTTYSYSASFAVALSSRPIIDVRRIWAEGNILRGAAGDFKSPTGFRVHGGDEDQLVDPLIAAAEGVTACPAFRGLAYVVFEDMDLSPFGNRIPSLSFEVEADAGTLSLAVPLGELAGASLALAPLPALAGMAISADSRRDVLEPLTRIVAIDSVAGSHVRHLGEDGQAPVMRLGEPADDRGAARAVTKTGGTGAVPRHISVNAYDPDRDFQSGVQTARVAGGQGAADAISLPMAMASDDAKALAQRLAREAVQAARITEWPTGFAALAVPPGTRVRSDDGRTAGRISERMIEGSVVRLTIASERLAPVAASADCGRVVGSPDAVIGTTVAWLFDLPLIDGPVGAAGAQAGSSRLMLAAGGSGAGWRSAGVTLRAGPGALPIDLGNVSAATVLGQIESISAADGTGGGQAWLFDRDGAMIVTLLRDDMLLSNADDAALIGGANLAVAGGELLQFGHAEPLGARRWRLTQLLRGRYGSEDAMAQSGAGAGFALIDDPALMLLPGMAQVGGSVGLTGQGDPAEVVVPILAAGRAMRPLSPCGLTMRWRDDGGLDLGWTRRSRLGFGWNDSIDAPLDERSERYRLTLGTGVDAQVIEIAQPDWTISAADVLLWRGIAATLSVEIVQLGDFGPSAALFDSVAL